MSEDAWFVSNVADAALLTDTEFAEMFARFKLIHVLIHYEANATDDCTNKDDEE